MADEIEQLVIGVRADTRGFASDVAAMRGQLTGPLAEGAGRAGQMIERSLSRALANGKLGFDQLKSIALKALAEIAAASLRSLLQPSAGGGSGLGVALSGMVGSLAGAPGRATGGPVSAGKPYLVGERGPELFVPGHGGRIERLGGSGGGRDVRVGITLTSPRPEDPQALRQSSRQVARAVRASLRDGR